MIKKFSFTLSVPVAILLGAVLVTGAILYTGNNNRSASVVDPTEEPIATPIKIADPGTLLGSNDAVLGNADAKVTIVEFSDFQCPFCRTFFNDTYSQLKKEYIDTGKVRFVFRHFPLSFHPGAKPAAIASLCAKDQGKFWEMHDIIFAEQEKKGQGTVTFEIADLKTWAKKLSLNTTEFNSCLDSETYAAQVDIDINAGIAAGVEGTPSFFVNGTLLVGAQPFSEFQTAIDAELN